MLKEDVLKPELSLHFEMDIENELACYFDEIHYINDPDRGRIWEETIMLLPKSTQLIDYLPRLINPNDFVNGLKIFL